VAVKIKLMRMGKIRAPYYRIVIADARTKRDGRSIETIGKYHPTQEPSLIEVDSDRAQYWLGVGAQPTEAVAAILKVTGDWQKFKGLPGADGTLRVADARADKKAIFEAAAKQSTGEAKDGATTPRKRAAKKAADKPAATAPAEAAPAPEAPAPEAAAPEGAKAKAAAPEAAAPEAAAPEAAKAKAAAPEAAAPDPAAPEAAAPEASAPEAAAPDPAAPEAAAPEASAPEAPAPDAAAETTADTTDSGATETPASKS
jgi:small subunit ribosomal protein S16